jgi:hypothetical protein
MSDYEKWEKSIEGILYNLNITGNAYVENERDRG